jgi:hypothetical protein
LSFGERLATLAGPTAVLGIQPQQAPQTVYNLEVQGQHVFRVTSNGLLVHNTCPPRRGALSNMEARQWYLAEEAKILGRVDPNLPLRERAIQAFNMRNQVRTKARELMSDRELAAKLMREEPNITLRELVKRKYQKKGLVGDELWQDILDSSRKSRTSVNKKLGLE